MKAKIFALVALVLGMVSCQKEINGIAVDKNGEAAVTISVALPEEGATRAGGADSAVGAIGNINLAEYDIRYILEVYDVNDQRAKRIEQFEAESTQTSFALRLVPGRHYRFVVWADFVREGSEDALHYNAENLTCVSLINGSESNYSPMDETRDAYTGVYDTEKDGDRVFDSSSNIAITLTRPFAKLRVVTTDMKEIYSSLVSATVNYTSPLYNTFNALNATAEGVDTNVTKVVDFSEMTYTKEQPTEDGKQTLFADYLFGAEDDRVMFTLDVEDATGLDIPTVIFNTNIPVQRNYLTTVAGPILTDSNNITVTIEERFAGYHDVFVKVASAQELADAIENAKDGTETVIEITDNIVFGNSASTTSTRAQEENNGFIIVPKYKSVSINLNGKTISGTENTAKNFGLIQNNGNLTISGEGTIKLTATVNSGWGRYSAVISNNPGSELTVNEGVVIEHLGGTDMAYGIDALTNGGIGAVKTTINGATVKSTYRAVRQFLNSDSTQNELVVKAGTVLESTGNNKSIFFHDPSTKANLGKLTVEEGALLYGDVYLFVTEGSTEWPVEVSIAASALVDNSEVLSANVPAGYAVELENGVYSVAYYDAVVTTKDELNKALLNNNSILLGADINYGADQLALTGKDKVINLNGYTLTTNMAYGGMAIKDGASIKNGHIVHTSAVAAIKAFNVGSIENVTIETTCATVDKTVTGIAVQQGGYVGAIKNVTINGVSQGIEVGYQATVDLVENTTVDMATNGTANGIGMVINGGKVGLAKDSTFKGAAYGVTMHLKGVAAVGLELENCKVEGVTASIYAWDEKGISNTSGSLVLTYDAATTLTGPFVWDFEEECQGVVTLNRPE
ncbi:MAG: hypothetical protein IKT66_07265 [Alistipes sp.]|nr:hypothetical protein [Alistipes sp.]